MSSEAKERRKAWRAQARADLCRPGFWFLLACLYVFTFLLVTVMMFVFNFLGPYIPWLPQPYVSPDPPPLVAAFYCANFILAFLMICIPPLYLWGGPRKDRSAPPANGEPLSQPHGRT